MMEFTFDSIPPWIIAGGVGYGIFRQWLADRVIARELAAAAEQRAAATVAGVKAAAQAATAAEASAVAAAEAKLTAQIVIGKTDEHAVALTAMAEDLKKIEVQGNGNVARMEDLARTEGRLIGIAEGVAALTAKNKETL
jgi:hypothetical protein